MHRTNRPPGFGRAIAGWQPGKKVLNSLHASILWNRGAILNAEPHNVYAPPPSSKRWVPPVARIILGLVFVVFGLNGFFGFIPIPPHEGAAATFMGGLGASGYFFPLLKGTEVIAGLLLLSGRFVPLALTILAPITVNIFAMHAFLAPEGLGMAALILVFQSYLAWVYRDAFRSVVAVRAIPRGAIEPRHPPPTEAATAHQG